ncbi:hypothetical protein BDY19DRAFT_998588 [Irpex rosettiformis]|uniref:Uncharacterized protein n=1 Tax=Irpex rosettiformis TaxID=378272 RepID=A0ACB8TN43_9APHY|nr:hypothetical protein BDY19DRAFT_998588 [Irpex rosettiformis]
MPQQTPPTSPTPPLPSQTGKPTRRSTVRVGAWVRASVMLDLSQIVIDDHPPAANQSLPQTPRTSVPLRRYQDPCGQPVEVPDTLPDARSSSSRAHPSMTPARPPRSSNSAESTGTGDNELRAYSRLNMSRPIRGFQAIARDCSPSPVIPALSPSSIIMSRALTVSSAVSRTAVHHRACNVSADDANAEIEVDHSADVVNEQTRPVPSASRGTIALTTPPPTEVSIVVNTLMAPPPAYPLNNKDDDGGDDIEDDDSDASYLGHYWEANHQNNYGYESEPENGESHQNPWYSVIRSLGHTGVYKDRARVFALTNNVPGSLYLKSHSKTQALDYYYRALTRDRVYILGPSIQGQASPN